MASRNEHSLEIGVHWEPSVSAVFVTVKPKASKEAKRMTKKTVTVWKIFITTSGNLECLNKLNLFF
jgi:hypothetical protein